MVGICIEVKTECKSCGNPLPMNALVERIQCASCQTVADFPYQFWRKSILDSAFGDTSDLKEGEGQPQTNMTGQYTFHLMYGKQHPRCAKCKTPLDETKYEEYSAAGFAVCSKCSNKVSVRTLPDPAKNIFVGVKYIMGEDADMFSVGKATMQTPNAIKPILFTCPSCAGNLEIDGKDRVVTCKYCNSEIYLPDDLWMRMHPVKTVGRWYLVFDDSVISEKLPNWYYLSDMTIDKDGNLYFITGVEDEEDTIVWSMGKDFKTRWIAKLPGYNYEQSGLAVSSDEILYVYDKNKHSLLKLSCSNGSTIAKLKGRQESAQDPNSFDMIGCDDLTVDSDGTLLAMINNKIVRYASDGESIKTWGDETEQLGFLGMISGIFRSSGADDDDDPNLYKLKNRPVKIDSDYHYVNAGRDGYMYFIQRGSSEDAGIAKYDRNGKQIWKKIVPLNYKDRKHWVDANGFIYILSDTTDSKKNLIRYNPNSDSWDTLLKDIREGGVLNEVDNLAVSADGIIYLAKFNNRLRVFDASLTNIYTSEKSLEDDVELKQKTQKKIEQDEDP
jgi:LSD1 subclass zinc finger protein